MVKLHWDRTGRRGRCGEDTEALWGHGSCGPRISGQGGILAVGGILGRSSEDRQGWRWVWMSVQNGGMRLGRVS